MEIRKMDRRIKTRMGMGKGDHWPVLLIKRRGETAYKAAPKDLLDIAKGQIKNYGVLETRASLEATPR